MASGQERTLRRRIRSVQSTKKITRAMELIAASRIVRAQARVQAAVPYSDAISERFPPASRPWARPPAIARALGATPQESVCSMTAFIRDAREKSLSFSREIGLQTVNQSPTMTLKTRFALTALAVTSIAIAPLQLLQALCRLFDYAHRWLLALSRS